MYGGRGIWKKNICMRFWIKRHFFVKKKNGPNINIKKSMESMKNNLTWRGLDWVCFYTWPGVNRGGREALWWDRHLDQQRLRHQSDRHTGTWHAWIGITCVDNITIHNPNYNISLFLLPNFEMKSFVLPHWMHLMHAHKIHRLNKV